MTTNRRHPLPSATPTTKPGTNRSPRRLRSVELFAGATELVIEHDEREYRLRITQNGRLILTA